VKCFISYLYTQSYELITSYHLLMTSLFSFFSDHTKLDPQSDECTPVKEYQFTFFSEYLYTWMYPLIDLGSRKPLDIEDIPNLPKYQTSLSTLQKLRRAWQEETKTVKHPSLYRAIFNSFGRYVIFGIFNCTLFVVISAIQPYFVTKLLEYISSGYAPIFGVNTGIGIAFVLGLSSIFGAFAANNGMYQFYVFGMLCRSALIGMIFEKSLNISNSVKSKSSIGEIITLMSVDVERIWVGAILLNWLWIGPLMALISMILLYFEVGYSCILVAVFLFGLGSIQEFVSKKIGQTREKLVKFTVERAKLTNEALQGIRVVKMYAWERAVGERIDSVRTQEVQLLRKYLILKITNTVLPFLGPVIMTYILFMSYVWIHGGSRHLTVRGVYAALSVLNLTRLPLAVFPLARASAEEGRKSMSRLREYFLLPEISSLVWHCDDGIPNDDVVSPSGNVENPMVPGNSDGDGADDLVYINQCTFTWQEDNDLHENSEGGEVEAVINPAGTPCTRRVRSWSGGSDSSTGVQLPPITISVPEEDITEFSSEMWGAENVVPSLSLPQSTSHLHVLSNVNLRIRRGELVGVVGSVGSGKSSLLSAILLQIRRIEGEQSLKGKVAYVSQEHWIQNRTLKDNVLFYDTADEDRYFDVMDSCQLSADLLSLPNADLTEIGERGITLSGGQKARVSIARALYFQDADLYIFDDPLAAVDAHVGRAVFEGAILSHLREKARVVSFSSNYHLLRHFDKIVVVGGKISGQVEVFDSYSNLTDAYPMYTAKAGQQDPDAGFCENGTSSDQNSDSNDAKMEPSIHRQSMYRKSQRDIEEKQQAGKVLTTIEDRERGRVSLKTVCDYFTASLDGKDGRVTVAIVLALFASTQCLRVVSDLWIGIWADDAEQGMAQHNQNFYMIYFTLLLVGTTGFVIVRSYHFLLQCLGASYSLHKQILGCVLAAPVNTYFDVTPLGRVLNRFTRDLDSVDAMLPDFFLTALQGIFHIVSVLILCILSTPYFVIVMIPLAVVFYVIQGYFRKTSRELKRLDGISRSPMYTHFGEMLAGLPTIRAYGKQKAFMDRHHTVADENKKCFFAFNITNRWLSLRLDLISTFVVLFVSLIAVIMVNMGSGVRARIGCCLCNSALWSIAMDCSDYH